MNVCLLIILAFMIVMFFKMSNQETFRFETGSYPAMVLTDSNGNLSSIPFPRGMVVIWTGGLNDIPQGWALCDGTQGTPDLRGRFVLGVNPKNNPVADLTATNIGEKAGTEMHKLTIEEMPSHNHRITSSPYWNQFCWKNGGCDPYWVNGNTDRDTVNTGGDKPHNNMPPFYTLAYIMKL